MQVVGTQGKIGYKAKNPPHRFAGQVFDEPALQSIMTTCFAVLPAISGDDILNFKAQWQLALAEQFDLSFEISMDRVVIDTRFYDYFYQPLTPEDMKTVSYVCKQKSITLDDPENINYVCSVVAIRQEKNTDLKQVCGLLIGQANPEQGSIHIKSLEVFEGGPSVMSGLLTQLFELEKRIGDLKLITWDPPAIFNALDFKPYGFQFCSPDPQNLQSMRQFHYSAKELQSRCPKPKALDPFDVPLSVIRLRRRCAPPQPERASYLSFPHASTSSAKESGL